MLRRVHELRSIVEFLRVRAPHYAPLARDDLHEFRNEILRASLGAGIAAAAGLFFACFLSIALIVSAWDSERRAMVAWCICGAWGVLALAGLLLARKAVSGPLPFRLLSAALSRDYAHLIEVAERDEQ